MEQPFRESGGWVSTHPPAPKKPDPPVPEEKASSALSVVGVQSIACGVILLLALLLRLAGGEAFAQVQEAFGRSLKSNDFLGAWVAILRMEEPEPEGEETPQPVAGLLPPEGAVAVSLRVNRPAIAPVAAGTLTSGYGYRTSPTGGGVQFHRGVDIAATAGTPIAAMYDGEVAETGESASLGRYIRLSHGDGAEVLYAHCSAVLAEEGAYVRAGETVALVGSTGDSTGNHVHIQVSVNGTAYNPAGCVPLQRYA